jgi:intracellular sulfur oxidation DsrE/DsrF family protein
MRPTWPISQHESIPERRAPFRRHSFRLEQCAIAARAWKVDPAAFLPAVNVVQNGYISIVAYQAKGYALLPMD